MVSLSISRLRELNLYGLFQFGTTGQSLEICSQSLKIGKISISLLLDYDWFYGIFKLVSLTCIWLSKM